MARTAISSPLRFAAPLLFALACSQTPKPAPVRVSYSEIPPPPSPAAQTSAPAPPVVPAVAPAEPDLGEAATPHPKTRSPREIVDLALSWASDGLRAYARGDYDAAQKGLSDARILVLEADMPEFWKAQGLAVLQSGLPPDLARFDLVATAAELERLNQDDAGERAEAAYIETELRRILARFGDDAARDRQLPELVRETTRYIDFYRGRAREFFTRTYIRQHKYWPIVEQVFGAQKLPLELGYIAFVESGFNPRAQSHANALGPWQFIPETGRRYGLVERADFFDFRKSTEAAADYLLDLISIFGSPSFLLATASYNAGEGRILSCLRQLENPFEKRTFWDIRGCLASETQEYVPRILAAAVLASNPKRFGLDLPGNEALDGLYDVVEVPAIQPIARLAEQSGIAIEEIRAANSELGDGATATPGRNFPLYVPKGAGERLTLALAALPPELGAGDRDASAGLERSTEARATARTYRVRRGDTLGKIAARHGESLQSLASRNHLRKPYTLRVGQTLKLAGGGASSGSRSSSASSGGSGSSGASSRTIQFTVRSGHTLSEIADLFSVRLRDLMRWNKLRSSQLRPGQSLAIHPGRPFRVRTYTVKKGDSASAIARRFGITERDLRTAVGLDERARPKVGRKLTLYVPG